MPDTLTEFLLARIAEDEAMAQRGLSAPAYDHYGDSAWEESYKMADREGCSDEGVAFIEHMSPARVLAECEAKRRIVEFHRNWPVLVERPTEFEPAFGADLPFTDQMTFRASRQIAWMTDQEYRNRFGDEPPTAPMLAAMAAVYDDHPDYRAEWKVGAR